MTSRTVASIVKVNFHVSATIFFVAWFSMVRATDVVGAMELAGDNCIGAATCHQHDEGSQRKKLCADNLALSPNSFQN